MGFFSFVKHLPQELVDDGSDEREKTFFLVDAQTKERRPVFKDDLVTMEKSEGSPWTKLFVTPKKERE